MAAFWAGISGEMLTASLPARVATVVISLLPLAMCMGVPFPQALAEIGQGGGRGVALAWSVNGAATVAGSILAVIASITTGFHAALWLGAGLTRCRA